VLLGCGLRRCEVAALTDGDVRAHSRLATMSFEFCNSDSGFLTFLLRSRIKCVRSGHLLTRHRATLRHSFEDLDQTPQLVGGQVLKCGLSNEPAATLSFSEHIGSDGAATASLGQCLLPSDGYFCNVPFTFGVPETLTLTLFAGAATFGEEYESASASGEAAYNGFLGFYDVYGDRLSGVTYQIGSVGQSTPEPGTLLLTAMAGAALLACALRRGGSRPTYLSLR
jgi:hypothetical protein